MMKVDLLKLLVSHALLLACLLNGSGGQSVYEYSSDSPATCGSTKTVNVDDVFFINDELSSQGRNNKAFEKRTEVERRFSNPEPSPFSGSRLPPVSPVGYVNDFVPYRGVSSNSNIGFPGFQDNEDEYNSKKYFGLENEYGSYKRGDKSSEENFDDFMETKFRTPYINERGKYPEQPSRFGIQPPTNSRRGDILSNLKREMEGRRINDSPSSLDNRKKPRSLPKFVRHLLKNMKKDDDATTQPPDMTMPNNYEAGSDYSKPKTSPGSGTVPLMEMIGNLGPDKIRQLKQLLGALEKNGQDLNEFQGGREELVDNGRGRRGRGYNMYEPSTFRMGNEGEYRNEGPQYSRTYDLDEYMSGPKKSFGQFETRRIPRMRYNGGADRWSNEMRRRPDFSEYSGEGGLPDAILQPNEETRVRRKRDVFPKYPFERLAEQNGLPYGREDYNDDELNSCRWTFRKGIECNELVVRIQYWTDGVRNCEKEYLLIEGNRDGDQGDRLCGGRENLGPYVMKGENVVIEHFREPSAGPGLTTFRATVQCA